MDSKPKNKEEEESEENGTRNRYLKLFFVFFFGYYNRTIKSLCNMPNTFTRIFQ